ncbi:MAG: trypsin-like peptidase domain-containing protein [Clostridia bacterium]|nr:trypsin-like peptidase domain-containing protein [Clostridia bacterium]
MLKKISSLLLVVALAFLAGFGGGMLANQQSRENVSIDMFGQKLELKKDPEAVTAGNVTINVSGDMTVAEAIAEKALPSVVGITTTYQSSFSSGSYFDFFGWGGGRPYSYDASSVGTGFIIDEAGYILTNSHVINDGTYKSVVVSLYDGQEVEGQVLWNDSSLDLAVVKIEASNLKAVEIGDSDTLKIGSYAAAIGNPLGLAFERSMSQGIISGLHRTIEVGGDGSASTTMEDLIQTDATINSGNSGGPLFNSKGQVIGINSAKASSGEGMGFAIPINVAKPIVQQIKETGKFERPYLGISGMGLESQNGYSASQLEEMFGTAKGIYVNSVMEGGGAEAAGLKKGDVIIEVDGVAVGTMNKINSIMISHKDGDTIEVVYMRDKESHKATVTLQKGL